ncbi:MAG: hypothetical protein IPJ88_13015 [Myxococcales bacterium]|nr:MAG: hypothetical protein IPJ88_13015 [Myxococcales bacterium]
MRKRKHATLVSRICVDKGLITELQFAQTISKLFSVPWVSLYHVEFTRELLNHVKAETAERYTLIPVYDRTARDGRQVLYVAMQDPTDEEALSALRSEHSGEFRLMVAPRSEIRRAFPCTILAEALSRSVPWSPRACRHQQRLRSCSRAVGPFLPANRNQSYLR